MVYRVTFGGNKYLQWINLTNKILSWLLIPLTLLSQKQSFPYFGISSKVQKYQANIIFTCSQEQLQWKLLFKNQRCCVVTAVSPQIIASLSAWKNQPKLSIYSWDTGKEILVSKMSQKTLTEMTVWARIGMFFLFLVTLFRVGFFICSLPYGS